MSSVGTLGRLLVVGQSEDLFCFSWNATPPDELKQSERSKNEQEIPPTV